MSPLAPLLLLLTLLSPVGSRAGSHDDSTRPAGSPQPTLYARLGGAKGVRCIAGHLVDNLASDSSLLSNPTYRQLTRTENKLKVKTRLAQMICRLVNGPCDPRQPVLEHLPPNTKLSTMDWLAVIRDGNQALDSCHVRSREKGEMVALLTRFKPANP